MTALPLAAVPQAATPADAVRDQLPDAVLLPADAGYEAARLPWNVAVPQRPAAVAVPRDTAEVVAVVRAAAADTFARVPTASLVRLHMDPEGPTPAVSGTALLAVLPDAALDAVLAVAGHPVTN